MVGFFLGTNKKDLALHGGDIIEGQGQVLREKAVSLALSALNFVLPPRCGSCRRSLAAPRDQKGKAGFFSQIMDGSTALCPTCWSGLHFIGDPCCDRCGLPFDYAVNGVTTCAACLKVPPSFDWCRTSLQYDSASKRLVLGLKHGRRTEKAGLLARLMLANGLPSLPTDPLLIPVPLHAKRLRARRFNQAHLIARALERQGFGTVAQSTIYRRRETRSQGSFGRKGRQRNVAHAFKLSSSALLAGRDLVIVDDVFTTGATVEAVARTLRRARPRSIGVLCAARAPGLRA